MANGEKCLFGRQQKVANKIMINDHSLLLVVSDDALHCDLSCMCSAELQRDFRIDCSEQMKNDFSFGGNHSASSSPGASSA